MFWAVVCRGPSGAVLEAPGFVSGLDDLAMMSEPVEQRRRHLGIAGKDTRPFAEIQVGGDDDGGALVEPADEMKEKLPAGLGEGEIAEFVETTKSSRVPVLFCNVSWMKYYGGRRDDDPPLGGGGFPLTEGYCGEECNFVPGDDGYFYGHFEAIKGKLDRQPCV